MVTIFVGIVLVVGAVVAGMLIYRNNQKTAAKVETKVKETIDKVKKVTNKD